MHALFNELKRGPMDRGRAIAWYIQTGTITSCPFKSERKIKMSKLNQLENLIATKLPKQPEKHKMHQGWGLPLSFGTFYVASETEFRGSEEGMNIFHRDCFKRYRTDLVEMIEQAREGKLTPNLPPGAEFTLTDYRHTQYGAGTFVDCFFASPHGIEFPRGIEIQVLYLLAGWLQLGESVNLDNYSRYEKEEGLKFLPLLIDDRNVRLHIYNPSTETIAEGLRRLNETLRRLSELGLNEKLIYIRQRANEIIQVEKLGTMTEQAKHLKTKFDEEFGEFRGKFGFLLRGLGKLDCMRFNTSYESTLVTEAEVIALPKD